MVEKEGLLVGQEQINLSDQECVDDAVRLMYKATKEVLPDCRAFVDSLDSQDCFYDFSNLRGTFPLDNKGSFLHIDSSTVFGVSQFLASKIVFGDLSKGEGQVHDEHVFIKTGKDKSLKGMFMLRFDENILAGNPKTYPGMEAAPKIEEFLAELSGQNSQEDSAQR